MFNLSCSVLLLQELALWRCLLIMMVVGKLAWWRYITVWLFVVSDSILLLEDGLEEIF